MAKEYDLKEIECLEKAILRTTGAYNVDGVWEHTLHNSAAGLVGTIEDPIYVPNYDQALRNLVEQGKIERREVTGGDSFGSCKYYIA